MSSNKKIFRNGGILYIRLIITSLMSLFTSRMIFQGLGVDNFGLYSVVASIVVIFNVLNTAMTTTTFRYIAFELGKNELKNLNKIFNQTLVLHFLLGILFVFFAETLGKYYLYNHLKVVDGHLDDAIFAFNVIVVSTFFSIISIPFQGVVIANEKFSTQAIIEILNAFLKLLIALFIVSYCADNLKIYSLLISIVTVVCSLLYVKYCFKNYRSIIAWCYQFDLDSYKEMIAFSGWILLGATASIGRNQGTVVITNLFFGTVLNASFAIANQLNSMVLMLAQSFSQAAIPQITKSHSSGNYDRTSEIACYVSKYSFFLMLFPALPILLNTEYILALWMGKVPEYTVVFCQLMIVNTLIDSLLSGLSSVVQANGKIKYFQIVLSGLTLLSIPITFILLKYKFPPQTILIVNIFTSIINIIFLNILLKTIIKFDTRYLFKKSYLKIIYVISLIFPVFFIQNFFINEFFYLLFISFLAFVWTVIVIYLVGMDVDEKLFVLEILKKIKNNFNY